MDERKDEEEVRRVPIHVQGGFGMYRTNVKLRVTIFLLLQRYCAYYQ